MNNRKLVILLAGMLVGACNALPPRKFSATVPVCDSSNYEELDVDTELARCFKREVPAGTPQGLPIRQANDFSTACAVPLKYRSTQSGGCRQWGKLTGTSVVLDQAKGIFVLYTDSGIPIISNAMTFGPNNSWVKFHTNSFDYYVFLLDLDPTLRKVPKIYRVEAFDNSDTTTVCMDERPDSPKSQVLSSADSVCKHDPVPAPSDWKTWLQMPWLSFLQTDVGTGIEPKH